MQKTFDIYKAELSYFGIDDVAQELQGSLDEAIEANRNFSSATDSLEYIGEMLDGTADLARDVDPKLSKEIASAQSIAQKVAKEARKLEKEVKELYEILRRLTPRGF